MLRSLSSLMLAAAAVLLLPACETTGNPREGGIFWSERKAQRRLQDRRDHLDDVDDDTDRLRRSNRRLEGAAARRQRMLNQ